jgi:hypothetical protein
MRRFFVLLALVSAVLGATGVALAGDAKGPPCSDISFENQDVSRTAGTPNIINLTLFTPKASCLSVTYTLVVLDDASSTTALDEASVFGDDEALFADGSDAVIIQATDSDTDGEVCVYATSSSSRGREIDRAPSAGCVPLGFGSGGGGGGYN